VLFCSNIITISRNHIQAITHRHCPDFVEEFEIVSFERHLRRGHYLSRMVKRRVRPAGIEIEIQRRRVRGQNSSVRRHGMGVAEARRPCGMLDLGQRSWRYDDRAACVRVEKGRGRVAGAEFVDSWGRVRGFWEAKLWVEKILGWGGIVC
jgi:hypothetical protein